MTEGTLASHGLRIAVIMGGQSAERDVSLRTGETVVLALAPSCRVKPVQILSNGRWLVPAGFVGSHLTKEPRSWFRGEGKPILDALSGLVGEGIDAAFNALHGPMGEDGTIQGLFRMLEIPLTGPDVIPAAVTMDKRLTKQVLLSAGLSTPRFFTMKAAAPSSWPAICQREAGRMAFPWIVKPVRLGSSVGVAIFRDLDGLARGMPGVVARWPESALSDDLLIEEVVRGRELTCGVLEVSGPPHALLPIEIRPRDHEFFNYEAKYVPGASEEICPAPLSPQETALVQETALRVHTVLDCAPLSRTDMFLTPRGTIEVLEVNTLPGMTATSLIPLSASKEGILLADLLDSLVQHALHRHRERSRESSASLETGSRSC